MSMDTLTIIQFTEITAAYLLMTFFLPALLLHRKLASMSLAARFMAYQLAGNFFMMNLVFLLQLLHISYRPTLILFTVLPCAVFYVYLNKKDPWGAAKSLFHLAEKLAGGQMGWRLFLRKGFTFLRLNLVRIVRKTVFRAAKNVPDLFLLGVILIALWHSYGANILKHYGYCFSDIPVHNFWINSLVQEKIFVKGIYPFGFHCVIYYLRMVFGIPTFVLLREFWFLQTILIHLVMLAFLRCFCKSKYVVYGGALIYILFPFQLYSYYRYYGSLPQEFGMLFILPSIWFLYAFLDRREEDEISARWYLSLFAASFSMTLAVHFYDTMIAGICCVGVAIGYFFRIFRKKYFWKILLYGLLSVFIAVLPMGIAFAMGTPLQGSLGWGLNVITGSNGQEETTTDEEEEGTDETDSGEPKDDGQEENAVDTPSGPDTDDGTLGEPVEEEKEQTRLQQLGGVKAIVPVFREALDYYLIEQPLANYQLVAIAVIPALFLLACVYFILRQAEYAAKLLAASSSLMMIAVAFCATRIGLPPIMDAIRVSIYYSYLMCGGLSLVADAVLGLLLSWFTRQWALQIASFAVTAGVLVFLQQQGLIRGEADYQALQSNDAITCTTNVIRDNDDFTWTIVSANEELRMGEDYGYHTEINDFLHTMENAGPYGEIYIPTKYVYIFIEKIPIDYPVPYAGSGQSVSRKGAEHDLPIGSGIDVYQGENRWIEMSRMYYWAKKFQESYPNEMSVYYETDAYVCYRVIQDNYYLFNFSIDYGYNMKNVNWSAFE